MSHSRNSLKEGYIGDFVGGSIGAIKGDTRSLDHIHVCLSKLTQHLLTFGDFLLGVPFWGFP